MGLTAFQRYHLATLPTPLEPLSRLSAALGGPQVYIKRDDLTGLAFGGNKTRKLEYLLDDAVRKQATHLITMGGIQSNHVRQTAAAARLADLSAELVLVSDDPTPDVQGNYLLDRLLEATCHIISGSDDPVQAMERIADTIRSDGGTPYVIPSGGSNAVGALGYVSAVLELNYQLWEQSIEATHLYHAAGSGGTQAGIALGAALYGAEYQVIGVAVSGDASQKIGHAWSLVQATAELLSVTNPLSQDDLNCDDTQVGDGYGIPTEDTLEAIELLAHSEGILLDPVYTGKAFAALLADIRSGKRTSNECIVFVHTGGTPALFAKREELGRLV